MKTFRSLDVVSEQFRTLHNGNFYGNRNECWLVPCLE